MSDAPFPQDTATTTHDPAAAPRLWVVVPCYDEDEVLPETARRLAAKLAELEAAGRIDRDSHVLLVDDGSHERA